MQPLIQYILQEKFFIIHFKSISNLSKHWQNNASPRGWVALFVKRTNRDFCFFSPLHKKDNRFNLGMSIHNSLRSSAALGAKRNVLKRQERVEVLKRRKEWREGDRVFNLKKTKFVA